MTRLRSRMRKAERFFRFFAAFLMILTGAAYVIYPPMSTVGLWQGMWPPVVWGLLMAASGVVTTLGLRTRILQVEQYGMLMMVVSTGMLVINQVLLMLYPPVTPTRSGGTIILMALAAFATARYFELASDIRSAKLAEQTVGE